MSLYFQTFETVVFFMSVLITNYVIQDGKSNYMEGAMLLGMWVLFFFLSLVLLCGICFMDKAYLAPRRRADIREQIHNHWNQLLCVPRLCWAVATALNPLGSNPACLVQALANICLTLFFTARQTHHHSIATIHSYESNKTKNIQKHHSKPSPESPHPQYRCI